MYIIINKKKDTSSTTLALYQFTHSINIIRFYYCFVFQPEYLLLVG